MRQALSLMSLFLLATSPAPGQIQAPEGGGIVYGDELGVGISAPAGWVFDSASGVSQGLHAVMYPTGSSWSEAAEVMYVEVSDLPDSLTFRDFIEDDISSFKEHSPNLVVEISESLLTSDGKPAQVRFLSGDAWGNFEAIAYVMEGTGVAVYVLSCRNKEGFDKSLPAFKEMISESFLATMVIEK